MTQVAIFNADTSSALTYTDKKGTLHGITAEGACFKGGLAMAALKDEAASSALSKAINGRYRPATDILTAAFPTIAKQGVAYTGTELWANKEAFVTFARRCVEAVPKAGKEFNAKQKVARNIASVFLACVVPVVGEVIEGAVSETV